MQQRNQKIYPTLLLMTLPYFFVEQLVSPGQSLILSEQQSKHIVQVLRMKKEQQILLTNGKGAKAHSVITDDHRKRCEVKIISVEKEEEQLPKVSIGISLIKNAARFEWFLEKATEIGVHEIIPLICERTEKEKFRFERMQNILISAMLQSQQCWLPVLHEPTPFQNVLEKNSGGQNFIAHCLPEQKQQLSFLINHSPFIIHPSSLILIGPEGDFTEKEIQLALNKNFIPVALGDTRLRTETAGIVSASILRMYAQ
jgi:16S rRNA (uracil1498-N3)-methyltransferase